MRDGEGNLGKKMIGNDDVRDVVIGSTGGLEVMRMRIR